MGPTTTKTNLKLKIGTRKFGYQGKDVFRDRERAFIKLYHNLINDVSVSDAVASYRINFPLASVSLSDDEILCKLQKTPNLKQVSISRTNYSSSLMKPKPVKEVYINVFTLGKDTPTVVKLETTIAYKDFFDQITTVINNFPTSLWFIDEDGDTVDLDDDQVLQSFFTAVTKYDVSPDLHTYIKSLKENPEKPAASTPCFSFLSTLRVMFKREGVAE
eukprot:TRINITY_DN2032_c0_g1_i1.p1 TRINITY_DN2032_c0_g1~~TRINITY_DN2032_c0_g1_i1.p1  ORF type:complete len:217 (+),score=37.07 TRINITY_DN2032_c0_g1_i1:82-732(+)